MNYPYIYISHHPSDAENAKVLAEALRQMPEITEENITYWGNIPPGSNISVTIFDSIKNSDCILVLCSVKYFTNCSQEVSWIRNSDCYTRSKVIPVPLASCLWEDHFPDTMPLPRENCIQPIPFDSNGIHKVVLGVKDILGLGKKRRYMPVMPARADSIVNEQSQEFPTDFLGIPMAPNEVLVPICGDSMSPIYENGDFAICTQIDREDLTTIKSDRKKIFVIRTKNRGTLLKYIGGVSQNGLTLTSENPTHDDIFIEDFEISSIFAVVRSVKIRTET